MNVLNTRSKGIAKSDYAIKSRSIGDLVQDRVLPRQVGSGSMRGQQTILGEDGVKIVLGQVPGNETETAITFLDAQDRVISKITALTDYVYDPDSGRNVYQSKQLPDGTYGVAGANEGYDVEDGFET